MPHPLDGCRRKIDRADEHIRAFNACLSLSRFPPDAVVHQIYGEFTEDGGISCSLIFSLNIDAPDVPPIFQILAGEVVYQLRSALDHLVWQLIVKKTNQPPAFNSAFPVVGRGNYRVKPPRSAQQEFEAQTSRLKQDISASAFARIEALQPFKCGTAYEDDALWVVTELNNVDKHRLLITTISKFAGCFVTVTDRFGKESAERLTPNVPFKKGTELGRVPFDNGPLVDGAVKDIQVRVNGDIAIEIAFDKVGTLTDVTVVPFLTELADHIRGVVESFAPEF